MAKIRVNIKSKVNNKDVRREKRNGRDYIIVPSATLPDNVIMNGGLYPAEEIERSYMSLERTPAPLGHPMVGNNYISAREPEAINSFWVGAHNENVRRENGRVYLDKVIDVEFAKRTEKGRKLLEAINKNEPIHTSTGVLLERVEAEDGLEYSWIATNMEFDHDAILLDQIGAATPKEGVGMMVNGDGSEIEVQNVSIDDDAIEDMAEMLARRMQWEEEESRLQPVVDKLKAMIKGLFSTEDSDESESNEEEEEMPISEEQFKALQKKVDDMAANQLTAENVGEAISKSVTEVLNTSLKPIKDDVESLTANHKAQVEAERKGYVSTIVNAGFMEESELADMNVNALKKLAEKAKPGSTTHVNGAVGQGESDSSKVSNELPE